MAFARASVCEDHGRLHGLLSVSCTWALSHVLGYAREAESLLPESSLLETDSRNRLLSSDRSHNTVKQGDVTVLLEGQFY